MLLNSMIVPASHYSNDCGAMMSTSMAKCSDIPPGMVVVDWVEVLHPIIHASGYARCPCKGYGAGSLWLLLLKPKTGGDKLYENHGHSNKLEGSFPE